MRRSLLGGATAGAVTFATAPVVRRFLLAAKSLDIPNERSSHAVPVPRGGGVACFLGVAAGAAVMGRASGVGRRDVAGVLLLAATGLADDQTGHLSPAVRLVAQGAAGALFAHDLAFAVPTIVGTAGVVNVVNFMDGINGITGSTAALWGASTALIGRKHEDPFLQTVGVVAAGSGLGFLPWNVPTASLFLGDVGSYLFGGLAAAAIAHGSSSAVRAWQVAAPLLPYGTDAAQAIVRRAIGGRPLTEAHREHVYQRLVDEAGFSHTNAAALHAAVAACVAALGRRPPNPPVAAALVAVLTSYASSPYLARVARRNLVRGGTS